MHTCAHSRFLPLINYSFVSLSCSLHLYQCGMVVIIVLWVFVLAIFVTLGNYSNFACTRLNVPWRILSFSFVLVVTSVIYRTRLILFSITVKSLSWFSISLSVCVCVNIYVYIPPLHPPKEGLKQEGMYINMHI